LDKVRIVTLDNKQALVMPFAFHARVKMAALSDAAAAKAKADAGEVFIEFQGPNSWVVDDQSNGKRIDKIDQDDDVRAVVDAYLASHPHVEIARQAITAMLAEGKVHDDLMWRHLALLPEKSGSSWQVKPILIDLTRTSDADNADVALAKRWLIDTAAQRQPIPFVEGQIDVLMSKHRAWLDGELAKV
jgi:hypothetical protein